MKKQMDFMMNTLKGWVSSDLNNSDTLIRNITQKFKLKTIQPNY